MKENAKLGLRTHIQNKNFITEAAMHFCLRLFVLLKMLFQSNIKWKIDINILNAWFGNTESKEPITANTDLFPDYPAVGVRGEKATNDFTQIPRVLC